MAKRNKSRNTQPQTPSTQKIESSSKIQNGLSAVSNFLQSADSKEHGTMAEELKKASTSYTAATDEQKKKLADSLEGDIQSLIGELKKAIDINKRLESDRKQSEARANQLEAAAEETKKKTDNDRKQVEKELKDLSTSQKSLADEKSKMADQLLKIKEQELDAESGFASKKMQMLEQFETEKEQLLTSLSSRKTKLLEEIERLKDSKTSLSEQENTTLQSKLTSLEERETKLDQKEFLLQQQALRIERKLKQSEVVYEDAVDHKAAIMSEAKIEFTHDISSLENQVANLNVQIKKYESTERSLLERLSAFKDIEREFGERTPSQVLKQIVEYRAQIASLTIELEGKPSEHIETLYKELKKQYESLEQDHKSNLKRLKETKLLANKSQMSVIDLKQLEKQKQAISKHNDLLKGAVDQLSADVDDLVNKQNSKTAFPALLELDSTLRAGAKTENIPNLKQFAEELQHRIAWDERENKSLFYQLEDIQLFIAGLAMSRLHILQGISGTGKTSLAKAFARAVGGACKTIYVQAGWRDKSDLVGHFNAFEKKFYELETLQGLYEAQCPFYEDRPYVILLDEMNLSRPEQYFAQFLSALEMDPKDRVLELMTSSQANSPQRLIDGKKIKIPKNVWFIGTANHDETTFEFADKTYDRAHVMELPRHNTRFDINKNLEQVSYSYSSLESAFEDAARKHQDKVDVVIAALDSSDLSKCLEESFNVSWGNRLERHLKRFIPVMLECGSDLGAALDHMLATKVLRAGKVTGRYDTEHEDIEALIDTLKTFWSTQNFSSSPSSSLQLLEVELKKKSRM